MTATRKEKEEVKEKVAGILKFSPSVVFVNFHGLPVADTSAMRRRLGESGVGYFVAKKTILKRAFTESKPDGEMPAFPGELALAYMAEPGEDAIAPAREIYQFQKKLQEKVSILGGIFEGKFLGKTAMVEIASIPSLLVLRGMFVNLINSPIQGLAIALNRIAQNKN